MKTHLYPANIRCLIILITFIASGNGDLFAQIIRPDSLRIPTPQVEFLTRAPDARSAGIGNAGVALSPDANATYWNASKLPYASGNIGASASYTPWLRTLVDDMWQGYFSAFKKLGDKQAVAVSVNYFTMGRQPVITIGGGLNGSVTAADLVVGATYARRLGRDFSMGFTLKYITSNIPFQMVFVYPNSKAGKTLAVDVSAYYKKNYKESTTGRDVTWSIGGVLSNLGGKVNYGSANDSYFIPATLKLGGGFSFTNTGRHKFNLILDASKLLTPTPLPGRNVNTKPVVRGLLESFSDAPGGFREEIQEVVLSGGAEYLYKNLFALRGGYYGEHEQKGGVRFFTAGAGIRFLKNYNVDFAYLIPLKRNNPLARTVRISGSVYF